MKRIAALLVFIVVLSACKKLSVDNEDPKIEVFLINGAETISTFTAGNSLQVEFYVTDNEQLQEAVLRLDNMSNPDLPDALKRPYFNIFSDIDSKQFGETINIPTDEELRSGKYRLMFQIADANGNSNSAVHEFVVFNPEYQPYVAIDGFIPAAVDGLVHLSPGDSLVTQGWIVDDVGLASFTIRLTGPQNLYNETTDIEESGFTGYNFEWLPNIYTQPSVTPGDYAYTIDVLNNTGHKIYYTHPVKIE